MPKRGENIRKRKDGRWEARYIADRNSRGKAIYHSVYGRSYSETKEKLKLQQLSGTGKDQESKEMLFREILNEWLQNNRIRYKQSTYSKYKYMVDRHLVPGIGEMKVNDINAAGLNAFLRSKMKAGRLNTGESLAPSYVRTMALIINAALKYGALEGICAPLNSEIFRPAVKQCNISTLSNTEYMHLTEYCYRHLNCTSIGILIALGMGLRVGEICALSWGDIDKGCRLLHVNHTVSRIKDDGNRCRWIIETPKTTASLRVIPVSEALMDAMLQIREQTDSDYIVSDSGNFVNPRTFEYRYHNEIRASKVTDINFHALRHTFATRCVEGGMDVKTLSEILGHSSVGITLNTYVHTSLELKKQQFEKVEEYFNKGQK